jgi:hypothetical protein
MFTIDYVIHTECDGNQPLFKVRACDYATVSDKQRRPPIYSTSCRSRRR